ncbi:MAG: long-chain fatty acid--CoA ligase [Pseudomonadales bacterium]|nr:long-chain fatty acid--CoA ligase [Pseudomonadales bacterium]
MLLPENIITAERAPTIPALFSERVRSTPDAVAYRFFDALNGMWAEISWRDMAGQVAQWQMAFMREKLQPGDRVAIMARNSRLWVVFDQAALSLGLVVVPLFSDDRADNVHYILDDAGVKFLLIGGPPQWERLQGKLEGSRSLQRIVSIAAPDGGSDKRLLHLGAWLSGKPSEPVILPTVAAADLASIVYTSGTTGHPKGVMLSHWNIISNAYSGLQAVPVYRTDVFLSFLPLSHTLERTVGYYLPMMAGASVAHARSVQELAKDLLEVRPTGLISVPRIYERVYARVMEDLLAKSPIISYLFRLTVAVGWRRFEYQQGRQSWSLRLLVWPLLKRLVADRITQKMGGRLRVAISGGAALSAEIARVFTALGVPVLQGYGLTEASPVVSVNRLDRNMPMSIGPALPGVDIRIGDNEELLVLGDNVMIGYWNDSAETKRVIDSEGWLHTGDKARIQDGFLYITGRIKDIIVLANGEKVSPADMELAIGMDPLFHQVLVIGEAKPYLCALVVVDQKQWERDITVDNQADAEPVLLDRIAKCLHEFPGYAAVKRVMVIAEPWTIENDMLTPTLKIKRSKVLEFYAEEVKSMYEGH